VLTGETWFCDDGMSFHFHAEFYEYSLGRRRLFVAARSREESFEERSALALSWRMVFVMYSRRRLALQFQIYL